MRTIFQVSRYLLGLFVDDGGFAAAILLWAVAGILFSSRVGIAMEWRGPLLFTGFALLLAWTCFRRVARRL
jgi:hypothetical protein